MKTKWILDQSAFDSLLAWLDPDRDRAGQRYEEIRLRLIKIFARRGCSVPEELTDETMNRVSRKVHEIANTYVGDPALYFYGVAQNVFLEHVKKHAEPKPLPLPDPPDLNERNHNCLDECLDRLDSASRSIVLEYYQDDGGRKINHRKELAAQLGIALDSLRMRIHRIRATLQQCVLECLQRDS